MTRRERTLALILLPALAFTGGGVFAYQFWYEPLRVRDAQIATLRDDIEKDTAARQKVLDNKPRWEKLRKISLPPDVTLAQVKYGEELDKLLRDSKFAPGFSIAFKQTTTRSGPTLPDKKPVYTPVQYIITAKADVAAVTDFLERFYKLPLLHQVRNLSLQRTASSRNNELDVIMTVEALALNNAEARKTLLPESPPALPPTLAVPERKYASIAGKDIFFGPPSSQAATRAPTSTDYRPFIKFDAITRNGEGPTATLWDSFNNQDYAIRPRTDGDGYQVDVTFYVSGRRRTLRTSKSLDIYDENNALVRHWQILKIEDRELILQDLDRYFSLRLGQTLAEMRELKKEEVAALGLNGGKPGNGVKAVKDEGDGK